MILDDTTLANNFELQKNGQSIRSINLGTWLDKPRVLKIENKKIEVIELA